MFSCITIIGTVKIVISTVIIRTATITVFSFGTIHMTTTTTATTTTTTITATTTTTTYYYYYLLLTTYYLLLTTTTTTTATTTTTTLLLTTYFLLLTTYFLLLLLLLLCFALRIANAQKRPSVRGTATRYYYYYHYCYYYCFLLCMHNRSRATCVEAGNASSIGSSRERAEARRAEYAVYSHTTNVEDFIEIKIKRDIRNWAPCRQHLACPPQPSR